MSVALLLAVASVAGAGLFAGEGKKHDVTAEIVAVDANAKTITIKGEKGENKTVPVTGEAVSALATVKAGDRVVLTCMDDDKGQHQSVTAIKPAKA
ncbi:MAG TPA: hypothetical protein VJV23_05545 [Candidatus Polarisedimenticolia bacterium]|nr:hypothetical protein [Candidatus Polarisedimenticolia bacterium]